MPNPNEPLTRKILEEVIDERVPKIIDERVPKILGQFAESVILPAVERIVKDEVGQSEQRLRKEISKDIAAAKHDLKVWVDEKMADLRGDIVLLSRKEDRKLLRLVDILRQKKVLNDPEAKELLGMEPFAVSL